MLMKNIKLVIFVVVIILCVIIYALYSQNVELRKEYQRLKVNQNTLIKELNSRQLTLTNREFLEMYSNLLIKFKELDIKSKKIENYINYQYRIKDTTISIIRKDSISQHMNFLVSKNCYSIIGSIYKDTVETQLSVNDDIDIILYKQKNKDFSWWYRLWHPSVRYIINAAAYSNCMKDTITIKKNVKIE